LDVVDFSLSKRIRHGVDFNIAIDNLNNKKYWETQNYFVSRLPGDPMDGETRVHGTPGFPVGVTAGLTFRLGER
jgi:outer membrane receptor protein involved in Fe transport